MRAGGKGEASIASARDGANACAPPTQHISDEPGISTIQRIAVRALLYEEITMRPAPAALSSSSPQPEWKSRWALRHLAIAARSVTDLSSLPVLNLWIVVRRSMPRANSGTCRTNRHAQ